MKVSDRDRKVKVKKYLGPLFLLMSLQPFVMCFSSWRTLLFVCWQDAQDVFLEQERDRMLTYKLVLLQKVIRGWHHRRRFRQMKQHCVTLQKHFRSFICAKKYRQVVCL